MRTLLVLGFVGCVFFVIASSHMGCGRKVEETIAEQVAEQAIESSAAQQGENVNVDIKEDGVSVKSPDGKGLELAAGDQAGVPEGFPEDVPVYPGLKITFSLGDEGESSFSLQGVTSDAADAVAAYYDEQCKDQGWQPKMTMKQAGQHMLSFSKDGRSLSVVLTEDDGQTAVMITAAED